MTSEKSRQFLERLIAAGEGGLDIKSLNEAEHGFAMKLIHDGEAGGMDVSMVENGQEIGPKQHFIVAAYGAHEALYIARGWAKNTRDGLLVTEEGRRYLRLALKPSDGAF